MTISKQEIPDEESDELSKLFKEIQKETVNNLEPVLYLESFNKSEIVKKIYRKNKLTVDITIEFWNGYKCEMSMTEYQNFMDNIVIPFVSYLQDIKKINTALDYIKQEENKKIEEN